MRLSTFFLKSVGNRNDLGNFFFNFNADIGTKKYVDSSQLDEPDANDDDDGGGDDDDDDDDIEAQIKKEVEGMKTGKQTNNAPFQIIRLDVECGMI